MTSYRVSISAHFSRRTSNSSARDVRAQLSKINARLIRLYRPKSARREALRDAALRHSRRMDNLFEELMIAVRRFSMTLSLEAKYAEIQWHAC